MNDYPSIPTLPTHNVARNNKTSNTEQFIEQVESKHKPRFMYNYDFLQQYCDDNNIELLENYSTQKVNRRLFINARCLTDQCTEEVLKDFRNLTIHGCFCTKYSVL